ncbi:dTDP-4-dehydrorhamnose reductase (EC 1.1.1.133) [Caballeronia glathei]|nr:dTDP-4-dehydrorhamnose reductase (EC 1.1.1.133) [Caballeronia glathei]
MNAGGYTAVDQAETEVELAHAVNAEGPRALAEEARAIGALFVHYSTDYVFDGKAARPYTEQDEAKPISEYGRTKLAGERAVIETGGDYYIFRASWIYGLRGANFVKSIARAAQTRDSLSVVFDQCGAPTAAALVADVTAHAVRAYLKNEKPMTPGLYHLSASGETNWYEYSRFIVDTLVEAGVSVRATRDRIKSIASADYEQVAQRPSNSRLDTSLLREALGIELPDWREGVRELLAQLVEAKDALH